MALRSQWKRSREAFSFCSDLLSDLSQYDPIVHFTNPIDMLKGGQVGEREPKTKWVLALAGFLLLGGGYYLAITSKTPIEAF